MAAPLRAAAGYRQYEWDDPACPRLQRDLRREVRRLALLRTNAIARTKSWSEEEGLSVDVIRGHLHVVRDDYPLLPPSAFMLASIVAGYVDSRHGLWWGSWQKLADDHGFHRSWVTRQRGVLEDFGLIRDLGREPGKLGTWILLPDLYEIGDETPDRSLDGTDLPPINVELADGVVVPLTGRRASYP